ncbi:MAG: hypothetical protein CME70_07075 [Halobacteriovorax sp.]|nr:hypothetical protein [Halobacteriovorax sp.]|tara:strand:- start:426581 stop:428272 length:1692 start_codon:yes stop_codon:yes gene_type:complete
MEDKSNPRIKEPQRSLKEENSSDGPLFSEALSISDKSDYLELQLKEGMVHLTLPKKNCNLKSIQKLNLNKKSSKSNMDLEKKSQRIQQQFWKGLNKFSALSKISKDSFKEEINRKQTIDLLHSELYSWHTLLRHLVSLPSFTNFNVCQILSHEKGTTNVVSYSFGTDNQLKEAKTSIESFNKVFTQIKKSKGNQFSQTQLTIPEFNFAGSFLANIFQLRTHNMLFLLSENSFFPIPEETISKVELIYPQIGVVLEKIIEKDLSDSKMSNLFRVFELLPNPISIHNHLGVPIFQNDSYKSSNLNEADPSNLFEAKLNNDYKLIMIRNSSLSKSDIQHFQRVGLLGELLNTLQHELSNPLFGIQLATDFLNLQPNDESVSESLLEISENCKRCQDIIKDFKFIYQGGDKILEVNLEKLIRETLTLTKSASRGVQKKVINNLSNDLITTNPTWLSQIIFNLIINSSQALQAQGCEQDGSGLIEIFLSNIEDGKILIKVDDNGPGIPEDLSATVFDPFYTTKEKGTGLGLAICQNLAQKLGGKISYTQSDEGGASFSLLLPRNEIHS